MRAGPPHRQQHQEVRHAYAAIAVEVAQHIAVVGHAVAVDVVGLAPEDLAVVHHAVVVAVTAGEAVEEVGVARVVVRECPHDGRGALEGDGVAEEIVALLALAQQLGRLDPGPVLIEKHVRRS